MKLLAVVALLALSGCGSPIIAPKLSAYTEVQVNGITSMRCPCERYRIYGDETLDGYTCTLPDGFWFWPDSVEVK